MNPSAPIGVFDSGVGGLSVLRAIRLALPHENLCYVADSGHVPYGTKTPDYLQARAIALTQFLLTQEAKAVVVACNTATVAAVASLRATFPTPIIAVEPAIKPAVAATKTGIIGVIATATTLASDQFLRLLDQFAGGTKILTQACPQLVQLVEDGDLTSPRSRALIRQYIEPLIAAGVDTLVLGCTHYPFLRPLIDEVVGTDVTLIDTGTAVAQQVVRVLGAYDLLHPSPESGQDQFWTSGEVDTAQRIFSTLWGQSVRVEPIPDAFA